MEINKLSTQLNGSIDGSKATETGRAGRVADNKESNNHSDKVSITVLVTK